MSKPIDVREAAQRLRSAQHILILTHRRPDGDTVGSAAALCRYALLILKRVVNRLYGRDAVLW